MSLQDKLVASLERIVGGENLLTGPDQLGAYAIEGQTPKFVARPANREEMAALVSLGVAEGLVMVPWGGATKMATGNIPPRVDLVISTRRLKQMVEYNINDLCVSVESGVTLAELQGRLAGEGRGFFIPLDPSGAAGSTLGGIVATNDSGPKRFLYGAARDCILGLKAVSPRGRQIAAGGKTVKNVSGYDMTKLFIGSWGTLGIISEVTFKILPLPEKESTVLIYFSDPAQAGEMARQVVNSPFYPAAVELLDPRAAASLGPDRPAGYLLVLMLEGVAEAVDRLEAEMERLGRETGASRVVTLRGEEHARIWTAIRDLPLVLRGKYPGLISLKANFPLSQYSDLLAAYEGMGSAAGIDAAWAGHAGNGIMHGHFLLSQDSAVKEEDLVSLISRMTAETVKRGGNLSLMRAPAGVKERIDVWGETRKDKLIMRRIKQEFDPADLLNKGRFV
ncbi:MAG: FAD-binding oxidoreductase [Smithellaceae bacterium]|nr:FAD-binding oxidoreductase [Smithellaceae bacterium]